MPCNAATLPKCYFEYRICLKKCEFYAIIQTPKHIGDFFMITLKNLSRPRAAHYGLSSIGENKETVNVDWYLKIGESLFEKEQNLISQMNRTLELCETDSDFQDKIRERLKIEFSEALPRIIIQSNERAYLHFNDNVKLYTLTDFNGSANIEINEFEKFVSEQNVPIVFIYEEYDTNDNNKITKKDLENNFGEDFVLAVNDIIKADIDCYNKLLNKFDFDLPVTKKYCGKYDGLTLIAENKYHCSIDTLIITALIIIMHLDEVNLAMDKQYELRQAEREKEQAELEQRVQARIEELKERILNDETFKVCERKNAIKYLKTIMKEFKYDNEEDYEVLEYLELSRTQYGGIRSKGYKGQSFIDDLWVKSRERH